MRRKNTIHVVLAVLAFFYSSVAAVADQIEKEAQEATLLDAPKGILVKVDPVSKKVEVFKADSLEKGILDKTASADENITALNRVDNPQNKIAEYQLAKKELDKDSSTDAWYYRWYRPYYRWNYWGGYYRPYYYNWYRPYYYYPGYFNYGYGYRYNYSYYYPYGGYYYGWYY